ncbi:MAG: hypothetical protein H0U57_07250 [Tatlockia sp.]|nr:hypothetical protein [Tatlockia sp.]
MSDSRSKLPDFKEISTMTSKFFRDVKTSIAEIIGDYKKKREEYPAPPKPRAEPTKPYTATSRTTVETPTTEAKVEKPVRTPRPRKPKVEPKIETKGPSKD